MIKKKKKVLGIAIAYCARHLQKFAAIYDDSIGFRQEIAQTSKALFLTAILVLIVALATLAKLVHRVVGISLAIHLYNAFGVYYSVFTLSWIIYKNEFESPVELIKLKSKTFGKRIWIWLMRPVLILSLGNNEDRQRLITINRMESPETFPSRQYSLPSTPEKNLTLQRDWPIQRVLKDSNAVDLLMNHLGKEYSMELLLSIIEMGQFVNEIKKRDQQEWDEDAKKSILEIRLIEFSADLPKSILVFDSNSIKDKIRQLKEEHKEKQYWDDELLYFKIIAYDLFAKYVRVGSKYEINIAYDERVRLTSLMENKTQWLLSDKSSIARTPVSNFNIFHHRSTTNNFHTITTTQQLFHVFDYCISEVFKLLRQSYARFERSPEFLKMSIQVIIFIVLFLQSKNAKYIVYKKIKHIKYYFIKIIFFIELCGLQ
ncbi:hypothetical protein RFI_08310 [Reticulomyxa filosa]|uniref:RGS domain-containing protein n=1 Tax=Reticulomyxa filosa TaxID=46433 RepID=X6NR79_RETFI|nr:hypothetical protein RFI_08310 [Reticulomyxa filosa]|eukprot:ETO28815.1 hypothetical protein RFI_08310 [Reticulomyxa filosa]